MTAMTQTNKEYATALFSLATENNAVDQYEKSLLEIGNIFKENPDYIKVLESPAIPLSERISFIDKAFESTYTEYLVSFIKVLCENGNITEICSCIEAFCDLVRIYKNRTIATVYYVEPLTEEQKEYITGCSYPDTTEKLAISSVKDYNLGVVQTMMILNPL